MKTKILIYSVFFGVSFFLLLLILSAPYVVNHFRIVQAKQHAVWFDDINNTDSTDDGNAEQLLRFVNNAITNQSTFQEETSFDYKTDDKPRILFLTLSDGHRPYSVIIGTGRGMYSALENAITRAKSLFGYTDCFKWIKLDIVREVYKINQNIKEPFKLERSLCGLAFSRKLDVAFLPEEIIAYDLIDEENIMNIENISMYLKERNHSIRTGRLLSKTDHKLYHFTTSSYFFDGENVISLYRGHRQFDVISPDILLDAVKLGGDYLINALGKRGNFNYVYSPNNCEMQTLDNNQQFQEYSILRHAGATYAMLELYEIAKDKKLFHAIDKAIRHLLLSSKTCYIDKELTDVIVEDGYVKLGGNALTAIVLAKYIDVSGDRSYMPNLLRIGKWIQKTQAENGEFLIHKQDFFTGEVIEFNSLYYPGEAVLALLRIYKHDSDPQWLDAAEKGARYLINTRDHGLPVSEMIHDHWLLYSLNELYRYRSDSLYIKHTLKICQAIIRSQNTNPLRKDWIGSYYYPPTSVSTASRTEGLCAAYKLIRDFGNPEDAKKIMESIQLGIRFQLQTQCLPETVLYYNEPKDALGGFKLNLIKSDIRVDYVQHNMSSLLGLYHIFSEGS